MTPYQKAIQVEKEEAVEVEQAVDLISAQAKLQWLASDNTKKMVKALTEESNQLVADAIGLALMNHQTDNSKQIVHTLIKAEMLRKVVRTYATAS